MKELYDYLSHKRDEMSESGKSTVEIDVKHLFKLHQMVCFMMQIKQIVNFVYRESKQLKLKDESLLKQSDALPVVSGNVRNTIMKSTKRK